MSAGVTLARDKDVGIITIDNPPVNALNPLMLESMMMFLRDLEGDEALKALVLIGRGRLFSAGGEMTLLEKMASDCNQPQFNFHPLMNALEGFPKPVICAMNGAALGGGLQIALACHYRIAVAAASLSEPEIRLGLIPNAGGTQRLPRLAGVAAAIDLCARGVTLTAAEAQALGIIDRVVTADFELLSASLVYARELIDSGAGPRRTRDRSEKPGSSEDNAALLALARADARTKWRGQVAPLKAVDAVEASTVFGFDEGCLRETALFQDCLRSGQAGSLIHLFLSERAARKPHFELHSASAAELRRVAVIGGGTMGGGIAMAYAAAGIPVLLKEISSDMVGRSMAAIRRSLDKSVERGRTDRDEADRCLEMIRPALSYEMLSDVDLVVEAVFEDMELKKQVFGELDRACPRCPILASNTSTLDIDDIAGATSRPERVVGHHFFAPAQVMRLLEIVRGRGTSEAVIATSLAIARRLGKVGVVVGNGRGFVGNRLYHRYQREAQFLVEEGASVADVDLALFHYGMAMGPFATADMSGLDVGWRIRRASRRPEASSEREPGVADHLCELGRYGQKSGAGWYRYEPGIRTPIPDPEVERIIEACSKEKGIVRRRIEAEEIVERAVYALINEGARVLEEGLAGSPADIDLIFVHGYGFPAFRGGPMWYADTVGLRRVYRRVCEFERCFGTGWSPAPLLKALALSEKSFAHGRNA